MGNEPYQTYAEHNEKYAVRKDSHLLVVTITSAVFSCVYITIHERRTFQDQPSCC